MVVSRLADRRQLTQPRMVLSGLQLSGMLFETIDTRRVTLLFPVAIPPPLDPVFRWTKVPSSDVVPRLDIAPPRPPETLRSKTLSTIRDVPAAWVFRPPPLIGAVFPERELPTSVRLPELMMPPPPTPVVVFPSNTVWMTFAVAP